MEALLKLFALIVLTAAITFLFGALLYVVVPDQPLLAAIFSPILGVGVVAGGIVFGVDKWAMATVRRTGPWSDAE
jgi:hypothetical protein